MNLFFILTVVSMHCVRTWEMYYGSSDSVISFFLINLEVYAMAFFFMMSGFWLFYDYGKYNYIEMLKKKVRSIFIPYILWGLLKLITVQAEALIETGQMKYSLLDSIKSLLFIQIGTINFQPLNDALWYLIRIMSYFIVAPILYYLIKGKKVGIVSLLALTTVSSLFGYYSFGRWLFAFCFGGYMALHYKEKMIIATNRPKGIPIVFTLVIYIVLCAMYPYFNRYEMIKDNADIIAIMLALFILTLGRNPSVEMRHPNFAFMLYCSHMILITFLVKAVNLLPDDLRKSGLKKEGIGQSIVILICCLMVGILYFMLKKFTPRIYRLLVGGRN